jgi:hypothetical protein
MHFIDSMNKPITCLIMALLAKMLIIPTDVFAEERLKLTCNIIFDHYAGVENSGITKDVVLQSNGHKTNGMVKVAEANGYEFLVMIYSTQRINNQSVLNNFQVMIKDKIHNLSMSALSDSVYVPGQLPHHARIDLTDDSNDTHAEKGDLLFECRHFE